MSPERYQQASEIYHAALERKPEHRAAFLDKACGADVQLRREVESLLAAHDKVGNYFASPALEVAAGLIDNHQSPSLVGQTLSHYRVLSLLGAGGMGEVYLAEDTRLDRKVAIKFLPPESVGDERAKKRLLREAQAAAKLDHPNICSIHEVAEEDSRNFIVMQYVEGETLASRLHGQPLALLEALTTAIQVADALSEAHSSGVIHRDVKPANIVLTARGQAKVMDFGLAKVITDPNQVQSEALTAAFLTEPGTIVGTVPYMSPEQVQGETLDARSDIFSLGAVLYEMVGGQKAFTGKSAAATFSAILSSDPPPLARYTPEVPAELERITRKCLEKSRERRYQSMRDVLTDLENLRTEYVSSSALALKGMPGIDTPHKVEGAIVASVSATVGDETRRLKVRRLLFTAVAATVILSGLTGAVLYFWGSGKAKPGTANFQISSIAVLPLRNLSDDASQEYFADGMTEALISELGKIGALRVVSRQSVMQYKRAPKTMPEIARELNVDAVVDGSVLRSNDHIRITAQLVRAASDEHMWAQTYDRELRDVLALQGDIARGIASEIRIKLTPQEEALFTKTRQVDPAAHDAYLNGLYWLNQGIDETRTEEIERFHKKSFEYFEQAIKLDPNYALAHSALSGSYMFLATSGLPEFYPKAKESALKAVAIDDSLAEAHSALAYAIWRYDWNFEAAEVEFKRAQELAPNRGLWERAQFLSTIGRHEEAIRQFKLAQDRDPLTVYLKISAGQAYIDARQYDQAIKQFQSVIELAPKQLQPAAHGGLGSAYILKGMHDEGIAALQRANDLSGGVQGRKNLAWANAMAGNRSQAITILNDLKDPSRQKPVSHYTLAGIYAALGKEDQAMEHLQKAYAEHDDILLWLKVDPTFDNLRYNARFTSLLRRIGFPE